jgi:glucitol operon activator protein
VETRAVVFIIIALGVGWALQLALAYRQATTFNRRVRALTELGPTAVGRAGTRTRGVVFAAIAADGAGTVRGAEILKGLTVFAKPRPFPQLVGRDVHSLARTESKKTTDLAIADAASHLLAAQDQEGGEQTT